MFPTASDGPRSLQEASKIAPRQPKRPPRGPQVGPRGPKDRPRGSQEGPKTAVNRSKRAPTRPREAPKAASIGVRRAKSPLRRPKRPQEAPKRPHEAPKRPPRSFQEAPRRPPGGPKKAPRSLLLLILMFSLSSSSSSSSSSSLPRGRRRGRDHDPSQFRLLVGIALFLHSASFLLRCCTSTVARFAAGSWIVAIYHKNVRSLLLHDDTPCLHSDFTLEGCWLHAESTILRTKLLDYTPSGLSMIDYIRSPRIGIALRTAICIMLIDHLHKVRQSIGLAITYEHHTRRHKIRSAPQKHF